ncbi:cytochrome P450 [Amycolatopsis sp. YIM 10]|uniref:cytochrome P450 n=1 Tax=Amycolatopsis sp. YIM 10 TaxID=2653857 RepID=UPI0012908985|nr:cytochrome P450 [Amycolatopsis sp. YIM 10]QFU89580.1 Cytochrome P450 130 [Amycolatopsis sp. YIM 10]
MSTAKTSADAVTIDWDHNAPASLASVHARLNRLAAETPIVWNTAYGGFWVIAGFDETNTAYQDWETFSSMHDGVEGDAFAKRDKDLYPADRTPRTGLSIPEQPARFVPTECDPPMHTAVRRLEAPFFTPKAVRSYEEGIREHTIEALEAVRATGRIDFSADLANVVPVKMASKLIGGGVPDWETLSGTVHNMMLHPVSSPEFPMDLFLSMQGQILDLVKKRKESPQGDVASALMAGSIFDVRVEPEEAQTILNGLTFGSTDTTATTVLHTLRWLSGNPEAREQLRQSPDRIPKAVEEFLRLYTPSLGVARTVARDAEFFGHALQEGQRVLLLNSAANRDPRKFPRPLEVDFDRENVRDHIAFGSGPHRCLGAPVARLELKIMLEEVLRRMPDFTVIEEEIEEYPRKGGTLGLAKVPARFTPSDAPQPAMV